MSTAFAVPVLGVFDEVEDGQSDLALDRREDAHYPAPRADLSVQPLLAVGRGDPLLVDLWEVAEQERVHEVLFQATDGRGESLLIVVDEHGSSSPGTPLVRLEPDLL